MKRVTKTIRINAPVEKVWEVMTNNSINREWYAEFAPGSHARTDWVEGSKALFTDETGTGMIGQITANNPNELIMIEYHGIVENNIENYDKGEALEWKGAQEIYTFAEENGVTNLKIEVDVLDKYYEIMEQGWNAALSKLKEIAER